VNSQEHRLEDSQAPDNRPPTQEALASSAQRLGNFILDTIFFFVFAFALGILTAALGFGDLLQKLNSLGLGVILLIAYFAPQEALSGRTLVKMVTGTKAVNEDGTKLAPVRALGRTLCRFIPFEPLSFLGQNRRPRGWHDRIPGTIVISVKEKRRTPRDEETQGDPMQH
jgi:uncharacterized RDD family membrane protein YckC